MPTRADLKPHPDPVPQGAAFADGSGLLRRGDRMSTGGDRYQHIHEPGILIVASGKNWRQGVFTAIGEKSRLLPDW